MITRIVKRRSTDADGEHVWLVIKRGTNEVLCECTVVETARSICIALEAYTKPQPLHGYKDPLYDPI